eukprot:357237_1
MFFVLNYLHFVLSMSTDSRDIECNSTYQPPRLQVETNQHQPSPSGNQSLIQAQTLVQHSHIANLNNYKGKGDDAHQQEPAKNSETQPDSSYIAIKRFPPMIHSS